MTGSVKSFGGDATMDDQLVELAILGILAERSEVYPPYLVSELRRRAPMLRVELVGPVLERLWRERRVARLWHRYLLPDRVPTVRARWLSMIEHSRTSRAAREAAGAAYDDGQALLQTWDGWRIGAVDA